MPEPVMDDDAVGQIVPVPLVDEVTDALREAALVGDSDDEVETDNVTVLVGEVDEVKHCVAEPDTEKDVEELNELDPVVEDESEALSDAANEEDDEAVPQNEEEAEREGVSL